MTVDLTAEEMELVLLALKAWIRRRQSEGSMALEETNLVARLEVIEREHRGEPPHLA